MACGLCWHVGMLWVGMQRYLLTWGRFSVGLQACWTFKPQLKHADGRFQLWTSRFALAAVHPHAVVLTLSLDTAIHDCTCLTGRSPMA